jgi:protease-4
MNVPRPWAIVVFLFLTVGCATPQVTLFPDARQALQEFTLEGSAREKILLIPVNGLISNAPKEKFLRTSPGMVQEIVSHLNRAEKDDDIRAVLLKIDSPGGSTTASDLLYHEILRFKQRTGKKVTVCMMDLAASGGYYIALPADLIFAHPTTVTGSVGVIFMRPKVTGLVEKIGVGLEINKSGLYKDMGSPFREATAQEEIIFQQLTEDLGQRFIEHVAQHRKLDAKALGEVATARVFLAREALALGLVDRIGYLSDAIDHTRSLAGLSEDARLVVYRRSEYEDDNFYNTSTRWAPGGPDLMQLSFSDLLAQVSPGFYYLWPMAMGVQ